VRPGPALDRLSRQAAPGIPFDERRGLIRNEGGRVCHDDGAPLAGEYAVGCQSAARVA
jgi:hypothetical protein